MTDSRAGTGNVQASLEKLVVSEIREVLKTQTRGTWVVQSVECLTVDFNSGHDPRFKL